MRKLDIEEIKKLQLSILKDIDLICRAHGFKYSVAFGTMIGVVRHKGFIPWDDDIDIMMPLPEMMQLKNLLSNHEKYRVVTPMNSENFIWWMMKICLKNTYATDTKINGYKPIRTSGGVFIDVFPMVALRKRFISGQVMVIHCIEVLRNYASMDGSCINPWNFKKRLLNRIAETVGEKRFITLYYEYLAYCYRKKYDSVGITFHGIVGVGDRGGYENITNMSFEGIKVMISEGYDAILRDIYGDYMRLPPDKERVPTHNDQTYYTMD